MKTKNILIFIIILLIVVGSVFFIKKPKNNQVEKEKVKDYYYKCSIDENLIQSMEMEKTNYSYQQYYLFSYVNNKIGNNYYQFEYTFKNIDDYNQFKLENSDIVYQEEDGSKLVKSYYVKVKEDYSNYSLEDYKVRMQKYSYVCEETNPYKINNTK